MLTQPPNARSWEIENSLPLRSTSDMRLTPTVMPVPRRLCSFNPTALELEPPSRLNRNPGSSVQVSRVVTSMSTMPSW